MVVCCGIVGRGACIQSLLVSALLLVLEFSHFYRQGNFRGLRHTLQGQKQLCTNNVDTLHKQRQLCEDNDINF